MKFRNLDLNLLVALNALLQEKSVSLAGKRIHLRQSAMSSALNRLRHYFKDDLLVVVGRSMVLTARAESLVEPVRAALSQIEATITSAPQPSFEAGTSRRVFSIVAADHLIDAFLPAALREIQQTAPHLTFEVALPGDEPVEDLERGANELLLIQEPYAAPSHPKKVLFNDDYVLVVCKENTRIGNSITTAEFLAAAHVVVRLGGRRGAGWEELAFQRLPKRRADVIVPDFSSVPHFLVGTGRIAAMHRYHAELYARHFALRLLPCPVKIPRARVVLQWHTRKQDDPGLIWLVKALCAASARARA
jgi:LysR family transcriptional regulator, nod-box dependent transcriptional activator